MTTTPPLTKLPWVALWLLGCLCEFFGGWAKDVAAEKVKGKGEEK